jgi:hypothetical protein
MRRPTRLIAAAVLLAAAVAPLASRANHCMQDVIIFSGVDTGQTDPNGAPVRPGPNNTLASCQVDPADESLALINPGATNMVVAYTGGGIVAPTGTLTFNGVSTTLHFSFLAPVYSTSGGRWESQSIPTTDGTGAVTASVFLDGEEINTVTYNKLV